MAKRHWEKVGAIGVDAGLCWVGDPCYVLGADAGYAPKSWKEFCNKLDQCDWKNVSEPLGEHVGLAIGTGYGDGVYPVYVNYGKDGRVMAVKIVFD